MKHYISAILNILLISSLCGCATEDYVSIVGQIEGTVIDGVSKKVIESCEVISPHNGTSLTDSHGHFSFQEVIPGTIQLTYKRLGYETTMCEVVVHAGKTTPANISLNPEKADCKLSPNTTILDLGNRNGVVELILKNTSNQLITYSIQCDATEISFDPPRGTIVGQNSSIIKVAVDRTELSEGHYERTASIITADSSIDIQIVFDKGLETRPTVSTISLEQDDMEPTTLVANGAIMSVGSSNIIQHGFCYSTQPEPSLVENEGIIKLGSLSTPANFTYNLARLDFEKQYYVRAYATNRQGTSYGEVISKFMERLDIISIITQDATSVTSSSAMLNVKVAGGNISDFIEVGFYYGTTEKCETKIVADSSNGQATNSAGIVINGLKSDTKYFFKGYGITKSGEKEGEIKSFQTAKSSSANTEINCETESASNITVNSAVIHGKFTVSGTLKIKEWGFYYGSNPTPSVKQACRTNSAGISTTGETMSMKLENLTTNKDYYFQSYVIDEHDNIIKGSINSFTTSTEVKCETSGATNITTESVTLKGRIVSGSTSSISQYGFYYGTTSACSQKCVDVMTSSDGSSFEANITNLDSDKNYYYRAFCITPSGEKLGETQSFHTIKITPAGTIVCNTGEVSAITTNSALIHGDFTVSGTLKIKEWGFYYGSNPTPSVKKACRTNSAGISTTGESMSVKLENLTMNKDYYFQSYVIDEQDNIVKGSINSFTTLTEVRCETFGATNITTESATLKGRITSGTTSSISQYGFYYGTTSACSQKCVDVMTSSDGSSFEANITNLDSDKNYYYKAFCVTPSGEKLGETQSFHTIKITPTGTVVCNTGEASAITTNSAVIHGDFTVSGTLKVKEWGFYYGTSVNPSIRTVCETNNTPVAILTKDVSYKIEKLSEGTTYYFQTYVIDELNNVCKGPIKTFKTSQTPTIVIDYLSISGSAESLGSVSGKLSGKATLSPNGNSILEAGFIYRTDGYDLDLSTNYNGKTVKVTCEIIGNSITLNNETVGGYLGGAYVRAYMILSNGSIIYSGPKIYVASGLPYHKN